MGRRAPTHRIAALGMAGRALHYLLGRAAQGKLSARERQVEIAALRILVAAGDRRGGAKDRRKGAQSCH